MKKKTPQRTKNKWIIDCTILCENEAETDLHLLGSDTWITIKAKDKICDKLTEKLIEFLNGKSELSSLRSKLEKAKKAFEEIKNQDKRDGTMDMDEWDSGFKEGFNQCLEDMQVIARKALKDLCTL